MEYNGTCSSHVKVSGCGRINIQFPGWGVLALVAFVINRQVIPPRFNRLYPLAFQRQALKFIHFTVLMAGEYDAADVVGGMIFDRQGRFGRIRDFIGARSILRAESKQGRVEVSVEGYWHDTHHNDEDQDYRQDEAP